jgi:hypothetical protein
MKATPQRSTGLKKSKAGRSELTQLDEQEPEAIEKYRDEEVRKTGARLNRMQGIRRKHDIPLP